MNTRYIVVLVMMAVIGCAFSILVCGLTAYGGQIS